VTSVSLGTLNTGAASAPLGAAGLPTELAERLYAESGGNPLFIVETMRDCREHGAPAEEVSLAPGVRAAIRKRLAVLDADSPRPPGLLPCSARAPSCARPHTSWVG
jgi:hypothetical protein